jgi:alpha-L-rhamnosidase
MTSPEEWNATWICDGRALPERDEDFYEDHPAPLFRTEFQVNTPGRKARLYVSGLGYSAL